MGFLRSNQLQAGLSLLILVQLFFLLNYHQKKVQNGIPNEKYPTLSIPGNFVSILSFHYLFALNKGSLQEMVINNTYKGRITKLYMNRGVYLGFLYEKAIEIEEGKEKNTVPIAKSASVNLFVSDENGNVMGFEDLRVGDMVKIFEVLDLTQRHPLANQKIIIEKIN